MEYCKNCGTQVAEGVKFCTSCGSAINKEATVDGAATPMPPQAVPILNKTTPSSVQPVQATPSSVKPTSEVYKEEPISTGGYFGIFFLMMIPLLNLLMLILWACGGCRKNNKRNFARAALLWAVIGIVISGLVVLAGGMLFKEQFEILKDSLMQWQNLK